MQLLFTFGKFHGEQQDHTRSDRSLHQLGTQDCFLKTFPCIHMSAVSSTSTILYSVLQVSLAMAGAHWGESGGSDAEGRVVADHLDGPGQNLPVESSGWVIVRANHSWVVCGHSKMLTHISTAVEPRRKTSRGCGELGASELRISLHVRLAWWAY